MEKLRLAEPLISGSEKSSRGSPKAGSLKVWSLSKVPTGYLENVCRLLGRLQKRLKEIATPRDVGIHQAPLSMLPGALDIFLFRRMFQGTG